ncbi:MAG: hypothetical protein ACI84C_002708 [Flavobacteriales bacterium]|jgi:hypothetical protein
MKTLIIAIILLVGCGIADLSAQKSNKARTEHIRLNTTANSKVHIGFSAGATGGIGLSARFWHRAIGIQTTVGYFGMNEQRQMSLGLTALGRFYRGRQVNLLVFASHSESFHIESPDVDESFQNVMPLVAHGTGTGMGFEFASRWNTGLSLLVGFGQSSFFQSDVINLIADVGIHHRF